jgi:hypothetical protein
VSRTALLTAVALTLACTTTLELDYLPEAGRRLEVAGIRELRFGVEATDARSFEGPRELGRGKPFLFMRTRLVADREVATAVREAVERELRSFDLIVVPPERADVVLRVEVQELHCTTRGEGGLPARTRVRTSAEANVSVYDTSARLTRVEAPLDARAEFSSPSAIVNRRRYEASVNDGLGELARRTVHHPDVLIAVQRTLAWRSRR